MIENDIKALVDEHYGKPEPGLLMLSNVGAALSKQGKWPLPDEDERTLTEITEATPGIVLVRDPNATSFIAVVPPGQENLADTAIARRKQLYFVRGLPRTVLLAFCLEMAPGQHMHLRLDPRASYQAGPEIAIEGFLPVDDDLRLPGLAIDDVASLESGQVEALEAKVREWCDRHGVPAEALGRKRSRPTPRAPAAPAQKASSALERLYAAQSPDLADRLIVPIDIALMLSRMP